jgi:TPR repeat protein
MARHRPEPATSEGLPGPGDRGVIEHDFETLDKLVARRGNWLRGPRRWLRVYLTGLAVLGLAALATLGYVTVAHPPPPGTTTVGQLEFSLASMVQQLGFQSRALEMFLALAEDGHREAQFAVGYMYDTGRDVAPDPAAAAEWYRKAADGGHLVALNNLAALYMDGRGVDQDIAEAVALYQKAARGGDPVAQTNLGQLYMTGRGVPQIPAEAIVWFRQAATRDHAPAMYFLGLMQLHGWGMPEDREAARHWFTQAAEGGSEEAVEALHELE